MEEPILPIYEASRLDRKGLIQGELVTVKELVPYVSTLKGGSAYISAQLEAYIMSSTPTKLKIRYYIKPTLHKFRNTCDQAINFVEVKPDTIEMSLDDGITFRKL